SCREVIGNIAGEEALEKGCQEAARILCKETILFGADVSPVLQDLDRRGVSRGPADAELLEPLDQARFGKARRRLREVLVGSDAELRRRIALAHDREQRGVFILVLLVAPFLVHGEEAWKLHHLAGGAQLVAPGGVAQRDRGPLQAGGGHLAR